MTPAEKRIKELIDRWLTSLDLHLHYVDLNDSAYNKVQPWPVHDRPTRWILEIAKQKALELQAAFESRSTMGDAKFAESMELMVFLATLVGIQHVQRYIPLADLDRHGQATLTELDGLKPVKPVTTSATAIEATVAMPQRAPTPPPVATPPPAATPAVATAAPAISAPTKTPVPAKAASADNDATREMPRPNRAAAAATTPPAKKLPPQAAPAPKPNAPASKSAATATIQAASEIHNLIINDAVRLLNWGRPWHELAELIARIADRPKVQEVRRILRSHRSAIEMRAAAEPEAEKK